MCTGDDSHFRNYHFNQQLWRIFPCTAQVQLLLFPFSSSAMWTCARRCYSGSTFTTSPTSPSLFAEKGPARHLPSQLCQEVLFHTLQEPPELFFLLHVMFLCFQQTPGKLKPPMGTRACDSNTPYSNLIVFHPGLVPFYKIPPGSLLCWHFS